MIRRALGAIVLIVLTVSAKAQSAGTPADHDELRSLLKTAVEAVNARDYGAAEKILHRPFSATLVTQDHFTDFEKLKAYFENLYTRDFLRMKTVTLSATPDDLAQFHEGPVAVSTGGTKEFYELTDGRKFELNGRWTAITAKQDGKWKLLAIHTGVSFLDNPVIAAIEKSVLQFALAAGGLGAIIGFAAGWFARRLKKPRQA